MKNSKINNTSVSRLGFGMMRLPLDSEGKIDFAKGFEMVDYALANGITYFDTAYRYHDGDSELFVKEALSKRHPRENFLLASKLPTWLIKSEAGVSEKLTEQLSRCGVEYFDFYLLHSIEEDGWGNIEKNRMGEILAEEKTAGRIRNIGASFHCEPALLRTVLDKYGDILDFIQLQLNYMDWDYINAKALHEIALEYNKPIVVMEPLRGGMLVKLPSEKAREILDGAENAKSLSYADFALGWVDALPNVAVTLSGMSTLENMVENIKFYDREQGLSALQLEAVNKAAAALQNEIFIPCTACNYCQDCPQHIKIPEIFDSYNNAAAKGFHHIWGSLSGEYKKITPEASRCIACGLCESACPQNLKIISLLKEVDTKFEELAAIGE